MNIDPAPIDTNFFKKATAIPRPSLHTQVVSASHHSSVLERSTIRSLGAVLAPRDRSTEGCQNIFLTVVCSCKLVFITLDLLVHSLTAYIRRFFKVLMFVFCAGPGASSINPNSPVLNSASFR